ncbi:hypothetical protein B0J13DRAFT_670143 [Dactylonectria estremocensis]|uniref:AAA+ ATPase domain-containing protein n=1 Tax=Dactylonectria estremocensis TaxID=1079267 RepID=A0A9P9FM65_9HYPO|nr:hypothetical protein B0J13DRAFT_670143 [Dactylonectria estremocensis]
MADTYSISSASCDLRPSNDETPRGHSDLTPEDVPSLATTLEAFKIEGSEAVESTAIKQLMEVVESGSECDVQTLYEGPREDCYCCKNWVEKYPGNLQDSLEQANESNKKAFVVRMAKNHQDGPPLMLDSVIVQSQVIKDLLAEVFHGYGGLTTKRNRLVFRSPFHAFYYRWKRFTEVMDRQNEKGNDVTPFAQLFYNIIELELRDTMAEISNLKSAGVITYEHLWALFEPGSRLFSSSDGHNRFYLLENCEFIRDPDDPCLALDLKSVDWDGSKFGYSSTTMDISAFSGVKQITDLEIFPAEFHPSRNEVEQEVLIRGKKFCSLNGFHYKAYSGLITYYDGPNKVERNVDGRMVVDASSFFYMKPKESLSLSPLDGFKPKLKVTDDPRCQMPRLPHPQGQLQYPPHSVPPRVRPRPNTNPSSGTGPYIGGPPIVQPNQPNWNASRPVYGGYPPQPVRVGFPQWYLNNNSREKSERRLTNEQLLLCNSRVRGFSLKSKDMAVFDVDPIQDISWNDSAFPNLMLPAGYRDLVLKFVDRQTADNRKFDDFIEGKGLGLTMLLVGNPGTGKTLTAEAIADKVRRPLYVLSASELGQEASTVESRLQSALDFTRRWEAVLLLDECDVFLEKRSTNNLTHNEILSVFLRMIEYYPGILFLTSNRPEAIDPAFQSRVHLTLRYPDLDARARKHIWKQFVTTSSVESSLTEEQITRLAMLPLNGRQIKNIVKISLLLVEGENAKLTTEHIQTVLRATNEIDYGKFEHGIY